MTEFPIACTPTTFTPEQRARHDQLAESIYSQAAETRVVCELPDGYALRIPAAGYAEAAEFILLERLCCPFFTFNLRFERGSEWGWLELTGDSAVKAFLSAELGEETPLKSAS